MTLTLFKSCESLSTKLHDNCETTGRKTGVNGSNWHLNRSSTC